MNESDALDEAIEQTHLVLGEFATGNAEPLKLAYSQRDDVSLAKPFGPPVRGRQLAVETMERAAALYRDGVVVEFERVAKYVTADLAYIVEVEHYEARIGGRKEMSPVALRVTSILRPEDGTWKIVHRHADPITTARPAESVVQR